MPRYEYKCTECGTVVYAIRSVDSRDEPLACSEASSGRPRKFMCQGELTLQPAAPAFVVKGASYRNGYQGEK